MSEQDLVALVQSGIAKRAGQRTAAEIRLRPVRPNVLPRYPGQNAASARSAQRD